MTTSDGNPSGLNLEGRLAALQREYAAEKERNSRLVETLRDARDQIVVMREEIERLAEPPATYGVFLQAHGDSIDISTSGRKMRVGVAPNVDISVLEPGQEVMLNEAFTVVEALSFERHGEVLMVKEILEDGDRALVITHSDEERIVRLAAPLRATPPRAGDSLLTDNRSGYAFEIIPKSEVEELVLEEVPDIDYSDIGGLNEQIEQITDAVELPFLHQDLFKRYKLPAPKGILLYGPPGCGKTLIAKAVANSLAKKVTESTGKEARSYFLNIKGPELLNKYVGESERAVRQTFQRARSSAPCVVFFDELDALCPRRGNEGNAATERVVKQLLTEMDGYV
jgi:proteasome-associated ATPase